MRLRRGISLLLASIVATVAAVAIVEQPAFANSPGAVVNLNSGMCLQPLPGPFQTIFDNGVRIAQMPCNGTAEQQWLPVQLGTGRDPLDCNSFGCPVWTPEPFFYVINHLTSLCLDVTDARTNDRAEIQQFECNNGGSEKWFKRPYQWLNQYVNSRTGKCLDIPNATTDATYVWQFHCTSSNVAQAFTFPS